MKKALRDMKIGKRAVERRALQMQQLRAISSLYYRPYNLNESLSKVTPGTSLAIPAVYCAINRISSDIASMGLGVFQTLPTGGSRFVQEHYLNELLSVSPDQTRTAFKWRQLNMAWILGWGNGYNRIKDDGQGQIRSINAVHPTKVEIYHADDKIAYVIDKDIENPIPNSKMLHLFGMSVDGVQGISPIRANAMTVSTGLEQGAFGVAYYQNASTPTGFIQVPGKLLPEVESQMRSSFETAHQGAEKAFRVGFLSGGATWVPTPLVNPVDAQLVESKRFTIQDVCRLFSVPPFVCQELSNAHYNNVDQAMLAYMTGCLRGWCECLEADYCFKLLTPTERADGLYIAHNMSDILRGDDELRAKYYASAISWGWMSVDEVRAREKMSSVNGGARRWIQSNMMTLDMPDEVMFAKYNAKNEKGTAPPTGGTASNGRLTNGVGHRSDD